MHTVNRDVRADPLYEPTPVFKDKKWVLGITLRISRSPFWKFNQNQEIFLCQHKKLNLITCKWLTRILILQFSILMCHVDFMNSIYCRHLVIVDIILQYLIYATKNNKYGLFSFFRFSKAGVRCISRPPNYVSKI